ncbi:transcription factor bHLH143-like [Amaranthus tricolor]|uniref:transcription factor bHLH143-like n=1 Tax=Amaranthus tricolor TaxID=29722 RepID=UPI002582F2F2|nr:transcription factor bHLH143-like [Amaranthus tricolor]
MVELSGSWRFQQKPPWESSAFADRMIAPVEHRQHESLPASLNPCTVSTNLGLNGFGFSGLLERGLTIECNGSIQNSVPHIQNPLSQNLYNGEHNPLFPSRVGEKPTLREQTSTQQKKFLIFDRSGHETRLIFSSLCPRLENLTTPRTTGPAWNLSRDSVGAYQKMQCLTAKQGRIMEHVWTRTPALCEESGENEIIDEVSEMPENSEEINALLYSDDDDDGLDDDCDGQDDDEVSSGHSPLAKNRKYEKLEDCWRKDEMGSDNDQVSSSIRSSKRQKICCGGNRSLQGLRYQDTIYGDHLIGALNDRACPVVGKKRDRKDNIHDTLRVLESIIPGLESKDPLVILDEAINYLKCLKYNAESMSIEDLDSSNSFEASN